mmetsp:Transcript_6836/g.19717  ORF Transcript_6836/g.19717 Transcript_6836/m.19717 type:complete len:235 (-) Transcript_6836:385-1089(-)
MRCSSAPRQDWRWRVWRLKILRRLPHRPSSLPHGRRWAVLRRGRRRRCCCCTSWGDCPCTPTPRTARPPSRCCLCWPPARTAPSSPITTRTMRVCSVCWQNCSMGPIRQKGSLPAGATSHQRPPPRCSGFSLREALCRLWLRRPGVPPPRPLNSGWTSARAFGVRPPQSHVPLQWASWEHSCPPPCSRLWPPRTTGLPRQVWTLYQRCWRLSWRPRHGRRAARRLRCGKLPCSC